MVNFKRFLVAALIFIAIGSCKIFSPKRDKDFRNNGIILKSDSDFLNSLDTNNFYVQHWQAYIPNKGNVDQYSIIKFTGVGMLQIADFTFIPNIAEFKSKVKSFFDYYKIEGSILKLEVYRGELASYGYWEGRIMGDSITFYKIANIKQKNPITFYKTKPRN